MKKLIMLIGIVVLSSCAGQQLKSEWKEKRGYSDADTDAIMAQYKEYNTMLTAAQTESNALNSAPYTNAQNRLRAVFCSCIKKLGDRCRQKPDGLAGPEKALWVKANAIDMTYMGMATTWEKSQNPVIDPAECQ